MKDFITAEIINLHVIKNLKESKDPVAMDILHVIKAILRAKPEIKGNLISVCRSDLVREMGDDYPYTIAKIDKFFGVWKNGSFYRVLYIFLCDLKTDIITFCSPWLYKISQELEFQDFFETWPHIIDLLVGATVKAVDAEVEHD